jgi:DNA-binding NarL/FixJ family response regulator
VRVLLADDHILFLESVSRLLAATFDIVGIARDGRQAVDMARRLRPDVVVVDIAMPGFTGFQTLEQLQRDGGEARVVFLTMHRDDEFVVAAIKGGAHGYVLKSRIHLDLIRAIDHAVANRLFLPSLTSLPTVAGGRHTAHFHANDSQFLDDVTRLVGSTLRSDEQVVFVTSEATRRDVAQRLQARHTDVGLLAERGQYVEQDSAVALLSVMHDGRPDRERVAEIVHDLDRLRLTAPNGPRRRLTIVGDISGSLCANGEFEAAVELERIWDELTRPLPFFTVCCYRSDCFERATARHQLARVCAEHSAVTC